MAREVLSAKRKSEIAKKAAITRWSRPKGESRSSKVGLSAVQYDGEDSRGAALLGFDADTQRLWATQENMAAIFEVDRSVIAKHIRNIFNDEELVEKSNVQKMHITGGFKPTNYYSGAVLNRGRVSMWAIEVRGTIIPAILVQARWH